MTDADRLAMIWIFDSPYILMDGLVVVNEHEVTVVTVWNVQHDTLATCCICCKMLHLLHDPLPMEILDKFLLLLLLACYCCFMFSKVTFGGQLLTLSYWTPWGQFVATQLLQFATGSTEPPGHRRPVPDPWLRSYSPSTIKNRELVSFKPSCFSQYAIYLLGERVKTGTLDEKSVDVVSK